MAKTTTSAMNRVPPFMPVLWQEWESDPYTSTMTDLQVGIFFKMLLRQWVVGSIPANVSDIIRECKLDSGRNTVLRFLESYPHLWTCDGCGADFVRTECGCSTDAGRTSDGQSTDAKRTNGVRRMYARRTNRRLKNLRIDVNSGLDLGTTKPNLTEPEPKPNHNQPVVVTGGSSESDSGFSAEQENPPVQPKQEVPVPAKEAPVSAVPKKEKSPAEQATQFLFKILGQPKKHLNSATDWSRLMQEMLDETGADLNDWKEFLTFTMLDNVSEDKQPRFTANWLPACKDPCQTLRDKLQEWYLWPQWENNKRVRKTVAKKKGQAETTNKTNPYKIPDALRSMMSPEALAEKQKLYEEWEKNHGQPERL